MNPTHPAPTPTKRKVRLLDLFCGAGGCTKGYRRAGFDVVGVDIAPQPHYPFEFVQADALDYVAQHGHEFDAIHASPPCQFHTVLSAIWADDEAYQERHKDLIPDTRKALIAAGKPYVIENVAGAWRAMENPVMLCGSMFGLKVYRHRLFETWPMMLAPVHVPHKDQTPRSGRGKSPKGFISVTGNGGAPNLGMPYLDYASMAMGIDWMTREELSQAIPPAYTEWIGKYLMEAIQVTA